MVGSYQFSNVLGPVYHKGNVLFAADGETLFSPVGNRVTAYDLKRCLSQTLSLESHYNITTMALSPDSCLMLLANERGEVLLVSTLNMVIIHRHRFHRQIADIQFSHNGKLFAVTKGNLVFVYHTPGKAGRMYNPFMLYRVLRGCYDNATSLSWSSDSRFLVVGSLDMSTRLFCVEFDPAAATKLTSNHKNDDNADGNDDDDGENKQTSRSQSRGRHAHISAVLGGHTAPLLAVFLVPDTLDCYTLSENGQLCCWTCSHTLQELNPNNNETDNMEPNDDESDDDGGRVKYRQRLKRHLVDEARNSGALCNDEDQRQRHVQLTAADYHHGNGLLVTGFSNGVFMLHEMPAVTHMHSLSISRQSVSSVRINWSGEWLALACGSGGGSGGSAGVGQLLVWEWRSETYVLKQQGHVNTMTCVSYSPVGDVIATGGHDGKVKLWSVASSFCFVTFSEHTACVSAVQMIQSGRAVVSASLDGTVRAFDTARYRNFRTLTTPRAVQFACLSVDSGGEMVAAGCQDQFDIYLWSLQHGKLLEVLSGHTGPVSDVAFNTSLSSSTLVSTSWDKTLRVWDVLGSKVQRETIELMSEGLAVVWRADGCQLCVSSLSGQLQLFDAASSQSTRAAGGPCQLTQTGCIESRADLAAGRADDDVITANTKRLALAFTSLSYTSDGQCVLAGGMSRDMCLYHVQERLLVGRFEITQNRSFDAVDDFINRRKLTEFGNSALVEKRGNSGAAADDDMHLRLPGAKYGDMASRSFKPVIRVLCLRFSPTGESFGAVTTEGLLIYSLGVGRQFEPVRLRPCVTRQSVLDSAAAAAATSDVRNHDVDMFDDGDNSSQHLQRALIAALQLNQHDLMRHVVEQVPASHVEAMIGALSSSYVDQLTAFISRQLLDSPHLQFYVGWAQQLLISQAARWRGQWKRVSAPLLLMQRALSAKLTSLGSLCEHNHYTLEYLCQLAQMRRASDNSQPGCDDVTDAGDDVITSRPVKRAVSMLDDECDSSDSLVSH